jgi:sugar phosphate isomerase/epimerase
MAAKKIPVALQLYSVRTDCEKDLPGVLKAVAKMGYDGVEFAGYYKRSAKELRKMLDDLNLKVAGTHIGLNTLQGDEFQKSVDFNKELGNKFLIVPWMDPKQNATKEQLTATAQAFSAIAARLKPLGLMTGYHNHHWEFTPLSTGELPWDIFFGNSGSDVVMQLDTGNAWHAGKDVVPYVRQFPGRARTVHLKEFSKKDETALLGEGDVDFKKCFELCESIGATEWYIIEQESYKYEPLKCVDLCLQNLRKLGR